MRLSSTLCSHITLQWWILYHVPGMVVPVIDCSHCKKFLSYIKMKHLVHLVPLAPCEDRVSILFVAALEVLEYCDEVLSSVLFPGRRDLTLSVFLKTSSVKLLCSQCVLLDVSCLYKISLHSPCLLPVTLPLSRVYILWPVFTSCDIPGPAACSCFCLPTSVAQCTFALGFKV